MDEREKWSEEFHLQELTYSQQMYRLEEAGLLIFEHKKMYQQLRNIGKTALLPYLCFFWTEDEEKKYFKTVQWKDIYYLYKLNEDLQPLITQASQKLEVALREHLAYWMEQRYGAYWHYDESLFQEPTIRLLNDGRKVYKSAYIDIQEFMGKYFRQGGEHAFREILNKLSFGLLYRIYSGLEQCAEKEMIANELGMQFSHIFRLHLFAIEELRNDCAHPCPICCKSYKIIDCKFEGYPDYIWLKNPEEVEKNTLYYRLCILNYFMQIIDSDFNFSQRLKLLLKYYKGSTPLQKIGFTNKWKKEPMWKPV